MRTLILLIILSLTSVLTFAQKKTKRDTTIAVTQTIKDSLKANPAPKKTHVNRVTSSANHNLGDTVKMSRVDTSTVKRNHNNRRVAMDKPDSTLIINKDTIGIQKVVLLRHVEGDTYVRQRGYAVINAVNNPRARIIALFDLRWTAIKPEDVTDLQPAEW